MSPQATDEVYRPPGDHTESAVSCVLLLHAGSLRLRYRAATSLPEGGKGMTASFVNRVIPRERGAPRSESKTSMIARGNHTIIHATVGISCGSNGMQLFFYCVATVWQEIATALRASL